MESGMKREKGLKAFLSRVWNGLEGFSQSNFFVVDKELRRAM
jgi:hypothetical protein